jgi:isocitrate/isopropylmalate dehydrogenase
MKILVLPGDGIGLGITDARLDRRSRGDGAPALVAAADGLIPRAVDAVLDDPATRTRDIGGSLGTTAFADALRGAIARTSPA